MLLLHRDEAKLFTVAPERAQLTLYLQVNSGGTAIVSMVLFLLRALGRSVPGPLVLTPPHTLVSLTPLNSTAPGNQYLFF